MPSTAYLARIGTAIRCDDPLRLACTTCGREWAPDLNAAGAEGRSVWVCPEKDRHCRGARWRRVGNPAVIAGKSTAGVPNAAKPGAGDIAREGTLRRP